MAFVACRQYLIPCHRCTLPFGAPAPEVLRRFPAFAALHGVQEFDEAGSCLGGLHLSHCSHQFCLRYALKSGGRFSLNARTPSSASSVL